MHGTESAVDWRDSLMHVSHNIILQSASIMYYAYYQSKMKFHDLNIKCHTLNGYIWSIQIILVYYG